MERSKGKMRPSLVRASDLQPAEAAAKPREGRTPGGHFAAGNRLGIGARWKATLKKALGDRGATGETGIVAADAQRVMLHVLRSLPSDAAPVRVMVSIHARHVALNAYFTAKAEAAGLDTPEGLKLLEVADRQSQRAERVLVTTHDLARVHAKTSDPRSFAAEVERANLEAEEQGARQREADRRARSGVVDTPEEPE